MGNSRKQGTRPPDPATLDTLTQKVDGLAQLVRSSHQHPGTDVHKLRWWVAGMAALTVAALALAAAAVALMLTSR